jgi:hypothetical protein
MSHKKGKLTLGNVCDEHFSGSAVRLAGAKLKMSYADRKELERKLVQARRLAMEPNDSLTRERLAQLIEEIELQLHNAHGPQNPQTSIARSDQPATSAQPETFEDIYSSREF